MENLIRFPAVLHAMGLDSRRAAYYQIKAGLLPPPVSIGPRMVAWPNSEIERIVAARVAGWDNEQVRELVRELEARRHAALSRLGEQYCAPRKAARRGPAAANELPPA